MRGKRGGFGQGGRNTGELGLRMNNDIRSCNEFTRHPMLAANRE